MRIAVVPEELRALGGRLRRAEGELESLSGQMAGLVSSIEWEVRQVSRVDSHLGDARSVLGRLNGALAGMADLLERKASAFAAADAAGVGELAAVMQAFAARHPELRLRAEEAEVKRCVDRQLGTGNLLPGTKSWWDKLHVRRLVSAGGVFAGLKVAGGIWTISSGWGLAGWGGGTIAGAVAAVAVAGLTVSGVGLIVLGAGAVALGVVTMLHGAGAVAEGVDEANIAAGGAPPGTEAVNPIKEIYRAALHDAKAGDTVYTLVDGALTGVSISAGAAGAASTAAKGYKLVQEGRLAAKAGDLVEAGAKAAKAAKESAKAVGETVKFVRDTATDFAVRYHDGVQETAKKRSAKPDG